MSNVKKELYDAGQIIIRIVQNYIKEVEKQKMTNEQFFLDVLDKLNEYSVKY